ncbi:MAG: diguanylate cyclase [Rhodoglobus sp.]
MTFTAAVPPASLEHLRSDECALEPIRTPGSIQAHGALLGVDRESSTIVVASENTAEFLGFAPGELLGNTVELFIPEDVIPVLRAAAATEANPARITVLGRPLDAILHRDGPITFLELEPADADDAASVSAVFPAIHRLSAWSRRDELLADTAVQVRALTGFDRVTVYHFHPDAHGEVVAESVADDMEPYLGLHFPASDIPSQARELYLTKLSRAIVTTIRPVVPLVVAAGSTPVEIDLSRAELRSVSPFHIQFMHNMGQASTVSFSLIYHGKLTGMITCAHRTERRISFLLRRSLEVLAAQVASQLGASDEVAALARSAVVQEQRTRLLGKLVATDDVAGAMVTGEVTVLDLIPAEAAVLCLAGTTSRTEGAPTADAVESAIRAIPSKLRGSAFETSAMGADYPEMAAQLPGFAGFLYVPLNREGDYLALLRREVVKTLNWLGDLAEQNRKTTLSPRDSFSSWTQSVSGTSLPWGDLVDEASRLGTDLDGALARREEARMAAMALLDPLTGLANRRYLMSELVRVEDLPASLSLLFIDLDEFKQVNDSYGHDAGDAVIREVGLRLEAQTRVNDRVARIGGDEFVVMCENITESAARALAARILTSISAPIEWEGGTVHVSASCGVASASPSIRKSELLQRADAAMYRAKAAGRNRVSL